MPDRMAVLRGLNVLCFLSFVVTVPEPLAAQGPEPIAEIRVHGNHTTPDADILALSGLQVGDAASEARLRVAERRLSETGRFEGVEIRRRHLSIDDPSRILVIIVVDEHPSVTARDLTPGLMRRIGSAGMWLPILRHEDGYGLSYGARYSVSNALGEDSRVSVPLSWGGERRVAIEAERLFDSASTVVRGGLSLHRRVNPHFGLSDTRREARVEVERKITDWLSLGAGARAANVAFGDLYDARHTAGGAHVAFDTRIDPSFPRNAVHARVGWERLAFRTGGASLWRTDVRGYVGVGGSTVLAVRGQLATSNMMLPFAEQSLLGGSGSLRGYATGHRAGDNLAAGTIEIRQPLNSPLSVGRLGVKAFVDVGTAWSAGARMSDQRFERGVGGGVYFGAGPFIMDLDLGWPETRGPRTHVGLGVSF